MAQLEDAQDTRQLASAATSRPAAGLDIPDSTSAPPARSAAPVVKRRWGGVNLGSALQAASRGAQLHGLALHCQGQPWRRSQGGLGAVGRTTGSLQEELAAKELDQIDKQIAAAEIRRAIAEQELENHELQIENAKAVDEFLRDKYTNQELYDWMVSPDLRALLPGLPARLRRRPSGPSGPIGSSCGADDSSFIQFGYWDSLRRACWPASSSALDLKRLEVAYLEQNKREYEITKHVSLRAARPAGADRPAKRPAAATSTLPEALFDVDYPGHYLRRIKRSA